MLHINNADICQAKNPTTIIIDISKLKQVTIDDFEGMKESIYVESAGSWNKTAIAFYNPSRSNRILK